MASSLYGRIRDPGIYPPANADPITSPVLENFGRFGTYAKLFVKIAISTLKPTLASQDMLVSLIAIDVESTLEKISRINQTKKAFAKNVEILVVLPEDQQKNQQINQPIEKPIHISAKSSSGQEQPKWL